MTPSCGYLVFDAADARFAEFQVWQDADQDGITDPGELMTLAEAGIVSIDLDRVPTGNEVSPFGDDNVLLSTSSFTRADGTTGEVGDVAFRFSDEETPATGDQNDGAQTTLEIPSLSYGYPIASLTGLNGVFGFIDIPALANLFERVEGALAKLPGLELPDIADSTETILDHMNDQSGLVQDRLYPSYQSLKEALEPVIVGPIGAPGAVAPSHDYADVDKLVQAMAGFAPNTGISTDSKGMNLDRHGDVVAAAMEHARQQHFS